MISRPVIDTPRGTVVVNKNGVAELTFKPDFQPRHNEYYSRAQVFVDSEVLRLCEPYTPLITGMLIKTGILGTEVGNGLVQWIAPYSREVYYSPRPPGRPSGPLRGAFWFERMKADHRQEIVDGARRIAGGG